MREVSHVRRRGAGRPRRTRRTRKSLGEKRLRWHDPSTVVVGLAIELVRLDDLRRDLADGGVAWRDAVFTRGEQRDCEGRADEAPGLAARLAAKTAALQALRSPSGASLADVEIEREASGRPRLVLHGRARNAADDLGATNLHVSLTHSLAHALAVVLVENSTS